jgi:hypothetical protein
MGMQQTTFFGFERSPTLRALKMSVQRKKSSRSKLPTSSPSSPLLCLIVLLFLLAGRLVLNMPPLCQSETVRPVLRQAEESWGDLGAQESGHGIVSTDEIIFIHSWGQGQ